MNYTKIKKVYAILLLSGLLFRLVSVLFTLDGKTGFINPDFFASSVLLSVLAFLCVMAIAILGFFAESSAEVQINQGILPGILALFVAIFSIVDIKTMQYTGYFPAWQTAIVVLAGVLNAAFFLYYAAMSFLKIKIQPMLYIVPLLFCIVKLIRFFAVTSSITIITDNIFTVFYYVLAVIFMLELGNFANKFGGNTRVKKLLSSGLAASMLSVLSTVPRIIKLAADKTAVAHESVYSVVLSLVMGLYIMTVTFRTFKD